MGRSVASKVAWAIFPIRRQYPSNSRIPTPFTQITVPSVRLTKKSG